MQSEITGKTLPVLQVHLSPGETLIAEPGQLAWMTPGIAMNTTTKTAGSSGVLGAVKRAAAGGGLFMTEFTAPQGPGEVAFAAHMPGEILEIDVAPGQGYTLHRHGFLCAMQGVTLTAGFSQSFGAGLFGGAGFLLQKMAGHGKAWVELGGDIVIRDLQPGQSMLVHPGLVGMFEDSVSFEVTRIKGIRNMMFGGDGLVQVRLTGPGRIWLQTLSLPGLAHVLEPYMTKESASVGTPVAAAASVGIVGWIVSQIFSSKSES